MRTRLDLRTRAEGKGIDWVSGYYRRNYIYTNQMPWENNRDSTWTKYKGRVAKWPSDQVAESSS